MLTSTFHEINLVFILPNAEHFADESLFGGDEENFVTRSNCFELSLSHGELLVDKHFLRQTFETSATIKCGLKLAREHLEKMIVDGGGK